MQVHEGRLLLLVRDDHNDVVGDSESLPTLQTNDKIFSGCSCSPDRSGSCPRVSDLSSSQNGQDIMKCSVSSGGWLQ